MKKKSSKAAKPKVSGKAAAPRFSKDEYVRVVPMHYPDQQKGGETMKKSGKAAKPKGAGKASQKTVAQKFSKAEFVRTVPLHYPKPTVSVSELSAKNKGAMEADLFRAEVMAAPAGAHLTYNQGPLIQNVEVFTVFWGTKWNASPAGLSLMSKVNGFFNKILVSPAIDQLGEYSVPGQKIGHGKLTGTTVISAGAPVGSVTDTAIRSRLTQWIKAQSVPPTTKNSLYFVYLEPGIVSIMGGGKSCHSFCGYHNNNGNVFYAVMPYPTCDGCLGGLSVFDALTGTSSHELCESITDPEPGAGWYDNVNGEIGDICAWNFKTVAGYKVQLEWSNQKNKCL
jgi:hypothetical protein